MNNNSNTALKVEAPELSDDTLINVGNTVLKTEAEAILRLANQLDYHFIEAINTIINTKGKVVVTGVGKSGHVGKKIAATLASTGTPSFFVHPNEASHGDMGMVSKNDTVIAISNSGESKELNDILSYSKRFGIPLIGITGQATSTLGKTCDTLLLLPEHKEACPNNLAPTTSTTLILSLGDALAITLLHKRGFTKEDYKVFHPGGKLGQQLLKISDIMHKGDELPVVSGNTSTKEALEVMTSKNFGTLAITDADNNVIGIITDGDIRRKLEAFSSAKTIADVMSPNPKTINKNALVGEAMAIMNNVKGNFRNITCLLVTNDENKLEGLLHIHDCLKAGF